MGMRCSEDSEGSRRTPMSLRISWPAAIDIKGLVHGFFSRKRKPPAIGYTVSRVGGKLKITFLENGWQPSKNCWDSETLACRFPLFRGEQSCVDCIGGNYSQSGSGIARSFSPVDES